MRSLTAPYRFATDGNYVAPGKDWNALPRILPLSAGALTAGFTPDTPVPAESLNYLESAKADAIAVQNHAAVQRWTRALVPAGPGLICTHISGMLPVRSFDANGERALMPVLLGLNSGGRLTVALSSSGDNFETPRIQTSLGAVATPVSTARGAAGELLSAGNVVAGIYYSQTHSNTWALQSWGSNAKCAVHYAAGSSTPYIILDNQGRVSNAASIAGLTASAALPSVSTLAAAVAEIADNGALVLVIAARVNAETTSALFTSTDGGATWTRTKTLTGANANVVYSKGLGRFIVWDDSGQINASATGLAWAATSTTATTANGVLIGYGSLAAAGSCIAKLWLNPLQSGVFFQRGIAYSFDLGATWNTWTFGDPLSTGNSLVQLKSLNGRFHAVDAAGVWVSSPLTSPASEF